MDAKKAWSLLISPDAMLAELTVLPEVEDINEELLEQSIREAGITFGNVPGAASLALQSRGESVPIARGTPPTPGVDAELTLHIDEQVLVGDTSSNIREDLYREVSVPCVEIGQLMAEVTPPVPGQPGMDIFGKEVKPPLPLEISLRTQKGAELSEDGLQVRASIIGRPRMEKARNSFRFQVIPSYTHKGDVTVEIGHLTFHGDIIVYGNVMEETAVSATGSVEIYGNVIGAAISTGQNITVSGNVIQSQLSAGAQRLLALRALPVLQEVVSQLTELTDALTQLSSHPQLSKLPFYRVVEQLITSRYPEWEELVKKLDDIIQQEKRNTPAFKTDVTDMFLNAVNSLKHSTWSERANLLNAATLIIELRKELEEIAEGGGDINVAYALNSRITAGRQINIKGQGSFHSHLEAGEVIEVKGKLRAGSVISGVKIYAMEVGSDAGAVTKLQVPSKGRIETDKSYENTLYFVGKNQLKITDTAGRSRTALDQDGRLILVPRG